MSVGTVVFNAERMDEATPQQEFVALVHERELTYRATGVGGPAPTGDIEPRDFGLVQSCHVSNDAVRFLCEQGDLLVHVTSAVWGTVFNVAGNDWVTVRNTLDSYLEQYPEPVAGDGLVPVAFAYLTPQGPARRTRQINVPTWSDIYQNYPDVVGRELNKLMGLTTPEQSGKLILWHGVPGTGKTYAIRALADAWKDWANVTYITDPEEFFGRADYMLHAILESDKNDNRYELLVLEDTGELMMADAKARQGQALSRLLNLADGLVGQGLRLLILITTNERLGDLHPAVTRPGRCLANIEFGAFAGHEAHDWLVNSGAWDGSAISLQDHYTLADLYELINRQQVTNGKAHKDARLYA